MAYVYKTSWKLYEKLTYARSVDSGAFVASNL